MYWYTPAGAEEIAECNPPVFIIDETPAAGKTAPLPQSGRGLIGGHTK